MKQFKKWEGTHSPGEYAYQKWEEGWRAALKWALEQEEWQGTDECGCWGVSERDIREELEE